MNFLDVAKLLPSYLYHRMDSAIKAHVSSPPAWLQSYAESRETWLPDYTQTEAQLDLFRKLSWVRAAVERVAEVAALTEYMVTQNEEHLDRHDFIKLLGKPNPLDSSFQFIFDTIANYKLAGNAYWWLSKSSENAAPDEIWNIEPSRLHPVPDGNMYIRGYHYDDGYGNELLIDAHEIVHFKNYNPNNRYIGLSAIEAIATTVVADIKMSTWNKNFFNEDSLKIPGILSFKTHINENDWRTIQHDMQRRHGGDKRNILLLRNVGEKGAEWHNTAFTQSEMDFLAGRNFNKDEIWSVLAPGMVAMLSENSTEANSRTGEKVFINHTVWPVLKSVAEKINNDLMPLYGDRFQFEFEDIRPEDRQIELAEQAQYALTHTIDEIRTRYYKDDSIGDERGTLLVAEVGQTKAEIQEPAAPVQEPDAQQDNDDEIKLYMAQLLGEIKALKQQPVQTKSSDFDVYIESKTADTESQTITYNVDAQPDIKQLASEHLELWQKKATKKVKASKSAAVSFESEHIPGAVHLYVSSLLRSSQHDGDMQSIFDQAAKMLLQLDDDDDEAEQHVRMPLEERATDRLEQALGDDFARFQSMIGSGDIDPAELNQIISQIEDDALLYDALRRTLIESVDLGVSVAIAQLDNVGFGFDWTLANEEARQWANQYVGEAIQGISQTTRRNVQISVAEWINNGEPLDDLIDELERWFSRARAELIASTEVTKAYAEGSLMGYRAAGVVKQIEWKTARDELVCPVCKPLHRKRTGLENRDFGDGLAHPPAHPRCRCWIAPVV